MLRAPAGAPACALIALLVAGSAGALPASAAANEALDAAFARLWAAETDQETAAAVEAILAAGADAGEVRARLRAGRPYAPAPTGRQALSRRNRDGVEHPYILHVPAGYDPAAPLPLRVYLHGGVMRPLPAGDDWWRGEDRWVRDDAIVVAPASWNGSPWWQRSQIENVDGLLADIKRRYNIDENRVHLLGVSDGATGAYYFAFKAATPWAAYLAFIGHPAVLGHPGTQVDGQMHVVNLRGRPLFIINGANDRLYPAAMIEPYVRLFADAGVEVAYRPQAEAGHDLSWWDAEVSRVEAFIAATVRSPLPDALSWETESAVEFNRSHWLVIDELGPVRGEAALEEHNLVSVPGPRTPLGIDAVAELPDGAGLRLAQVGSESLAEQAGLQPDDVILEMGGATVRTVEQARAVILEVRPGQDVPVTLQRGGAPLQLTLRFPATPPSMPRIAFPRRRTSGRVELARSGNTVEASTRGVRRFTLLVSGDQFDLSQPIRVVVNGAVAHDAVVTPDAATLLRWATVDWDRGLLFDAEIPVEVQPAP
ncbi:MAG: PDZ domain-containing protein [Acidobacteria bacterium]|nr:PDZ domain-containing protein [Acidobacteriota bacterium]